MMNTKKYTLIGLSGLFCVGIAAFFMIRGSQLPNTINSPLIPTASNMFSLVPGGFDQLVYIRVDDELTQSVGTISGLQGLNQLVSRVDSALVSQYTTGTEMYSLLFLEGEEIDIQELQQLGLIVQGEDFLSEKIGTSLRIYGTKAALDRQKSAVTSTTGDQLNNFVKQFTAGNYNIGVLSSPSSVNKLPILQQFSDKLLYTSIMTRLAAKRTTGKVTLQFADAVIENTKGVYTSKLDTLVSNDTLLYIEMKDMLSFLGVDEQQFLAIIPVLLGQYGNAYTALLSNEQYQSLWKTFEENVGIFVGPSTDSMFGLGISFVFSDVGVYDVFSTLAPVRYDLIQGTMGSGTVAMKKEQDSIVYSSSSTSGASVVFAEILKDKDSAIVALLGGGLSASSGGVDHMPGFVNDTAMVLRADLGKLSTLGALVGAEQMGAGLLSQQQGILVGDVQMSEKEQQISFSFSVKQ